jgi:hypothetical protein
MAGITNKKLTADTEPHHEKDVNDLSTECLS